MPTRPVHHRNVLRLQARQAAADIVDLGDHEVEMVETALAALGDADAVMVRVWEGAEESDRLAEAFGLGEVQHVAEEGDRLTMARCRPDDVPEPLDPGDAGLERLRARSSRQPVELHGRAGVGLDHACRTAETAGRAFLRTQRFVAHTVAVET